MVVGDHMDLIWKCYRGGVSKLGFMPSNHYSKSNTSRPEMGIMGIMNRAREMQIVENSFHVRMMFLLLGLLLSIVNLPTASGQNEPLPSPGHSDQNPPPPPPPPSGGFLPSASPPRGFPPPVLPPSSLIPLLGSPPSSPSVAAPAPSPAYFSPGPVKSPPPASGPLPPPPPSTTQSTAIVKTGGDTWNESEKAGVVIASIAALLQVAVVAFLLIKRHQMLTTVEYDDIEDLEYDTPPDSNFRDIESA